MYLAAAKVGGIHANHTYSAEFVYQNLTIQANVIDAAFRHGVQKLLFLGSSCIYPKLAVQPMREDALLTGPLEPTNEPYAIAKIAGIKLCESYNRQYGQCRGVESRDHGSANVPRDGRSALQQIYVSVTQLRFVGPPLDALHADLMTLGSGHPNARQDTLTLTRAIRLNQVWYVYPNAPQPALRNLNLTIPAKSTVAFVGATGSGKTTTVDLILGLLEAGEGTLEVDGQVITAHNKRAWQRAIGYVPQHIYLADDTVAANIAFGLDPKDIDQAAVVRAAKIANLHEFVINELPKQYQTTVGERGVRLSGGQRQRIGIARALYHNPQVLILDEATSALDNLTERAVMDAVHNLGHEITIILIAHRLSTVKACDIIFLLEKGELKAQGTFDELKQSNQKSKSMTLS